MIQTDKSRANKQTDYIVNNMNQIVETTKSRFEYDNSGNVVRQTLKASSTSRSFDYYDDGKLRRASNVNNDNCSYHYDCLGRLSMMNCSSAGVYYFTYHNSDVFGYGLSSIKFPNGTVVNFVYIPFTTIVTITTTTQVVYPPIVPVDPFEQITQPTVLPDPILPGIELPVTFEGNSIVPLINGDPTTVLNTNNKPFSFVDDLKPPTDLFGFDSFTSNLYQPDIPNLSGHFDSLANSLNNLIDIPAMYPTSFEPTFPSINLADTVNSLFNDAISSTMNAWNGVKNDYINPLCKKTGDYQKCL